MIGLSAAILAGGKSSRMGAEKAFLKLQNKPFIRIIYDKLDTLSDDIIVLVGTMQADAFISKLPHGARVITDSIYTSSPIGGIITAALNSRNTYFAVVATDMPLIKPAVIERLYNAAMGHSAAIPAFKDGRFEPLCSVYRADDIKGLDLSLLRAARDIIKILPDPVLVNVENFIDIDPELDTFRNINTRADYLNLLNYNALKV
ncbi:MAG: molybdenum cofactor guanylyltransferase [Nitrososphaerota archaeon]|jgi:molybdopterin-guanine dinucleotide biosynthesis protein A|nr:molybdenum cofactor guanylyltransferase [Nitrososphaerota archaeon]MDG6928011.1 molybdenum cofactor guanylyltransferase [Nitrososphaerota archaeon]MDG6931082.1 molybdenum cofactor guanylyltransferase [Nitrososphaerota archaeon]MDG6932774.1 molybdenum cofactor guanylyltransferase [Nitrososphaerota archaeon]MDG6936535.1 molybdenum cofactor guanylyltransferase [Nitrososphaerota archaeon]